MPRRIKWSYFFEDPKNFPWDLYDGVPKAGKPHVYICRLLASEFGNNLYGMMKAGTTLSHLERIGEEDYLAKDIHRHCSGLEEHQPWDRKSTAYEVVHYLSTSITFKDIFKKKITDLLDDDRIVVSDAAYEDAWR